MKKNFLFIALGLVMGSTVLTGCKKGENDPFLSLKSRDARITENWKLTAVDGTATSTGFMGTVNTELDKFDGTTWTYTYNGSATTYSYALTIEIKKDGTFESTEVNNGDTETKKGDWYWIDSKKNKTGIALNGFGTFEVNGLKSKELILRQYSYDNTVSGSSTSTDESTMTWTFEKQ